LIVDSIPAFAWYAGTDGKTEYLNQRILDFTHPNRNQIVHHVPDKFRMRGI
jgi:hypothetical protein